MFDKNKTLTPEQERARKLKSYIRIFLLPTLITKAMILFFGQNYAMYPGRGYGYGLVACMAFTVCSLTYFAWSQSGDDSEETKEQN